MLPVHAQQATLNDFTQNLLGEQDRHLDSMQSIQRHVQTVHAAAARPQGRLVVRCAAAGAMADCDATCEDCYSIQECHGMAGLTRQPTHNPCPLLSLPQAPLHRSTSPVDVSC